MMFDVSESGTVVRNVEVDEGRRMLEDVRSRLVSGGSDDDCA